MRIQVNTDSSIKGDERLEEVVRETLETSLNRFRSEVTRVEVHLSDENAQKGGPNDKRCLIEARVQGLDPVAVTHNAATVKEALNGGVTKLQNALSTAIGRRQNHRG